MTNPWHMARVASRRQLPKPRKMMGPVGQRMDTTRVDSAVQNSRSGKQCWYGDEDGNTSITACEDCGFHVCSCPPPKPIPREYDYPINAAQIAKFMTADDHELHVRQHAELADHLSRCGVLIACRECHAPAGEPCRQLCSSLERALGE